MAATLQMRLLSSLTKVFADEDLRTRYIGVAVVCAARSSRSNWPTDQRPC